MSISHLGTARHWVALLDGILFFFRCFIQFYDFISRLQLKFMVNFSSYFFV